MAYKINYNTGAGNEAGIETIDEAQQSADEGARYTQEDIDIIDQVTGNTVLTRSWVGCLDGIDECEDAIQFGSFGYYGDWA
jgi:hypothetical protein